MTSSSPRDDDAPDYSYMQRVKVYKLNENGTWDDKGTGHVSVEYMEQSDAAGLVVISEEDTSTLLIHRISRDDIYQRQGADTIISWLDPEIGTDIAISFQEAIGCNYIWGQIQSVQEEYCSSKGEVARATRRVVDEFHVSGPKAASEDCFQDSGSGSIEFPCPSLNNLSEVVKIISEVASPMAHDKVAACLVKKGYLRKLLDVFRTIEDLEDAESLVLTFKAVKGIVLLNDTTLFDHLLSDDTVMDVVGALEYDPELPTKQNHRAFLRDSVVFKEVVPITDPAIRVKIHQTYRIGYLKDVILARVLDDATFNTLSSLMLFNNVEVALALLSDLTFFQELFTRLHAHEPSKPEWQDLVAFLQVRPLDLLFSSAQPFFFFFLAMDDDSCKRSGPKPQRERSTHVTASRPGRSPLTLCCYSL
jgi:protein phosphatase-4 regulatory subunit 3